MPTPGGDRAKQTDAGTYVRLRRASDTVVPVELAGAIDAPSTSVLQHLLVDVLLRHRPDRVVIDLVDTETALRRETDV
jgi:hypothetical protein